MERIVKSIRPINTDTVHKICSGQVVLSLAVAVKELVENALDAGATNVEVRFKNYGIELIEVCDNGSGVSEDNFAALTLKYHTSKLNDYSDLLEVASFGFRGEALSSLCALANVVITTRHMTSDYATKIEYDQMGNITKQTPCSRQVGTTVTLSSLFHSLPVRQKEFHKNVKREFHKMAHLLYAYCLISLGVKITCTNQTASNSKTLVVSTQGSQSYRDNIACIFGVKQLQSLIEIKTENITNIKENILKGLSSDSQGSNENVDVQDVEIDLSEDSNDAENPDETVLCSQKSQGYKNITNPVTLTGFISSCAHGSGRSSTDRQYYYVNSRPCDPTKVMKLVNEFYRQYNPHQYPFILLNITLDRNMVDVNLAPDKRKIFLAKEKIILDVIKHSLMKMFESIPRTLKVDILSKGNSFHEVKPDTNQPRIFNSFLQQFSKNNVGTESVTNKEKSNKVQDLKRKSTSLIDSFVISKSKKVDVENIENADTTYEDEDCSYESNKIKDVLNEKNDNFSAEIKNECDSYEQVTENSLKSEVKTESKDQIMYLAFTSQLPNTQIRDLSEFMVEQSHTTVCKTKSLQTKPKVAKSIIANARDKQHTIVTDKGDLGKFNKKSVTMKTSLDHVRELSKLYNDNKNRTTDLERVKFKSVINPVFNKKCEEELSKEISNTSFAKMKIIGQFNLGFIITQLDDDLFIIDQHATDEIYNFETLQKTTELTSQKLVIPQQLDLTSVNEQILVDNLDIFRKNGFTFEINEEAPPTKKVKLITLPMSKNWIFGKDDIDELLFMLRENPSEHCRPSRVRAMFASRACRKSVMIGTALSTADMKKLVDHMGEIDKPWNCPHGRPTIRHLVNLAMVHTKSSNKETL